MSARLFSWLCARLSGWVPAVIVSCAENAAQCHRLWGYRADRMLVIPNGYDLSRWHADAQARQAECEPWGVPARSEEHTAELQSLMRISYAVFCLKKKKQQ